MDDVANIFEQRLKSIFRPDDTRKVWEWAESALVIGERQSQIPGPFSTLITPYVREPLECFSNRDVTDLCLPWGSQTGKTNTIMAGACWKIKHSPCPTLWVMPNSDLAQSFSENRWLAMIEDSPEMRSLKPSDKDRWKKLEQQFQRCTLNFVGSNSPANLASRPCGLLIMDEIDKFARASERESSALMLAENRTKTYTSPLRVKTSTPTLEKGEIWQEFLRGDMRYYHMPCPHCLKEIRFVWSQVKWDKEAKDENGKWNYDRVTNSTYYECASCSGKILDSHKTAMLRKGRWIPTNENAERGRRSYHLNSLYAPWRSCNFGKLAVQWLQAKETLNGLQDFINGALAEPWEEDLAYERKADNISTYDPAEAWIDEKLRFLTVDVQESHFWVVCRAWASGGESRLIWEGKLLTFEDINDKANELGVRPRCVALDIAHRTSEVCQHIVRFGWFGLWGDPSNRKHFTWSGKKGFKLNRIYSPGQRRDAAIGTSGGGKYFAPYFFWCGGPVKDLLEKLRKSNAPGWHIHGMTSEDYRWQMDAEVKRIKRNARTGTEDAEWYQVRKDNHLRDCELMNVVCALMGNLIVYNMQDKDEEPVIPI